jgi:hypothetical protein
MKHAAAVALVLTVTPSTVAAQVSCSTIDSVMEASKTGFAGIAFEQGGAEDFQRDVRPSVFLAGATTCQLDLEEGGSYTCFFQTGARKETSNSWGPGHLGYVVSQFYKWIATCSGYKGDHSYISQQRPFRYKGMIPVLMRSSLDWDKGSFVFTLKSFAG